MPGLSLFSAAFRTIERIPAGQPILVGHHSEARHRRDLERHDQKMRAAFEAKEAAKYYAGRAAGVSHSGISSDDPDAVQKLKDKLEKLETTHQKMIQANRCIRANDHTGLLALGFTEEQAQELEKGDFMGRKGFASYALTNSTANMQTVRRRISQLEAAPKETKTIQREGYTETHNTEENRVQLAFPGRPAPETRDLLKAHGFRWSPSRLVWQRQLNSAGVWAAREIARKLEQTQSKEA